MTVTENQHVSLSDQLMKESGVTVPTPAVTITPDEDKVETDAAVEEAAKKVEEASPPQTTKDAEQLASDIDDAKMLAYLSRKAGREIKSLDEFSPPAAAAAPTPEELKAREDEVRSRAIEFGKSKKLFTQSQYDSYVNFTAKDPADVVQADFVAKARVIDPTLSQDEAEELFNEFYHIHEDEGSFKYKQAQDLIKRQYEDLKNKDFSSIANISEVYSEVEKNEVRAKAYKTHVDQIFSDKLPAKFDFTIDGETISYALDRKNVKITEAINSIKADYLTVDMMNSSTDQTGKVDEAALLKAIGRDLKTEVLESMVGEIAKSFSDTQLNRARLGRKGVMSLDQQTHDAKLKTAHLTESDALLSEAGYPVATNR